MEGKQEKFQLTIIVLMVNAKYVDYNNKAFIWSPAEQLEPLRPSNKKFMVLV